jgi:hypothetical protein
LWLGRGGIKKKNPNKPTPTGEENWKLGDSSHYCYHVFFSSNRCLFLKLKFTIRCLPDSSGRVGHSFLLEFLANTPKDQEYLWIMDPGPMGTLKCVDTLVSYKQKFVICFSLGKQMHSYEKKILNKITEQGSWFTWYSKNYMIIVWYVECLQMF